MPDAIPASPAASTAAPGASPNPGTPGQPAAKQAPFGSSPATGPTPNRGYEAAAAQKLGIVLKQLGELIPMAGATSEMGMAIMDMIKKGSKFVPQGSVTPAAEKNQIDNMAMKNTQNNQQMQAIMAQRQQPAGAQGAAA
jgi:hypothetical protein